MKIFIGESKDLEIVGNRVSPFLKPLVEEQLLSSQDHDNSWGRRFDSYLRLSPPIFEKAALPECDLAILPMDWSFIRGHSWRSKTDKSLEAWALDFEKRVRAADKQLALFFIGDRSHETIALKDAITFRSGPYMSRRRKTDFAMPAFPEDLQTFYCNGHPFLRTKQAKPTIGFCGLAKPRNTIKDKALVGAYRLQSLKSQGWLDVSPHKGENLRIKALELLKQHPEIETNFRIRRESVFLNNPSAKPVDRKKARDEYVQNLLGSDYVLCCRGSGNFSVRLYETLCLGRIPVIINTDCIFPYDFELDWKSFCVWVEEQDVTHLGDKIAEFHASLSAEDFTHHQQRCRKIWEDWLSPTGFMKNLKRHFV